MIQSGIATLKHGLPEVRDGTGNAFEFTFPRLACLRRGSTLPTVLVTSSDETVLRCLADIVVECHLRTSLAFTVGESRRILDRHAICLVVCNDRLIDGKYEDILSAVERSLAKTPVIVVSRTGDWPDCLKAIRNGAFDYLTYPPIPGDLPRAIRHALSSRIGSNFREPPPGSQILREEPPYERRTHNGASGR